jgi:hypothetical protein
MYASATIYRDFSKKMKKYPHHSPAFPEQCGLVRSPCGLNEADGFPGGAGGVVVFGLRQLNRRKKT